MKQWNRRGGGAAVLIGTLLLALLAAENSLPADEETKATVLPADLAKIPSDGMFLFSIRVAELWNSDLLKSARGTYTEKDRAAQEYEINFGRDLVQLLEMAIVAGPPASREFEKRFGLPLQQVERLTLAIVGPPPASHELVMTVRTIKPYDLAKVLAANGRLKREKYNGETVYIADKWAVYPLDDRSLVYSEIPSELRNLINHPRPKEKGGLANALERAAEKHTMVYAFNIEPYRDRGVLDQLPPGAEPFRPLSLAHWATLVADIGAESRLTATFHFANENDAKAAVKPAQAGLDLLRASLAGGIKTLDKEKDMADLVGMLKQLETPLKEMRIERKGETLSTSVRARVDQGAAGRMLVRMDRKMRGEQAQIQGSLNLRQIALAMHNHADSMQGRLPAHAIYSKDGKPLLSWRVLLLPYIEQKELYNRFHLNEPWDSEHNKKLLDRMPKIYASPRDEKTLKEHTTYYQGFVGKGAFFEGKKGLLFPANIPDGLSNTIMIVEASKAVPWTKPEDIPYDPAKPLPKLGLPGAGGFLAALCDGSVRFFTPKLTQQTLRLAITRNDGLPMGADF